MISLSYLKYLWKSKKTLVLFSALITALFPVAFHMIDRSATPAVYLSWFISMVLAFAMPCILFRFFQDRRAVDTYLSINVSRRELLVTSILFSFLVSYGCYFLGVTLAFILNARMSFTFLWVTLASMAVALLTLIVVNSCGYLLANNTFDGLVLLAAYTFLPLMILMVSGIFAEELIAGYTEGIFHVLCFLSPSILSLFLQGNALGQSLFFSSAYRSRFYLITMLVYLVVFSIVLYRLFLRRKAEKAGGISGEPLSYPFVIHFYVFLCILGISCDLFRISGTAFAWHAVFYLIVFVLYIVANFIYKRRFQVTFKMIAFFLAVTLFAVGFTYAGYKTRGFGLSNRYLRNDPDTRVVYNGPVYYRDEKDIGEALTWFTKQIDLQAPLETYNSFSEETVTLLPESISVYYSLEATHLFTDQPLTESTLSILDKYRQKTIENYYNDNWTAGSLMVYDHYRVDEHSRSHYDNYYSYRNAETFSLEDLMTLSRDRGVQIDFFVEGTDTDNTGWYVLQYHLENGTLIPIR